jgi:hypothetical protein
LLRGEELKNWAEKKEACSGRDLNLATGRNGNRRCSAASLLLVASWRSSGERGKKRREMWWQKEKKEEMRAIGVGLVRTNEIGRGVDMEGGQLRFRLIFR